MDPAFACGVELLKKESVPLDLAAREWKTASNLLATSMERYMNACRQLKDAYPNSTRSFNNISPIWDVFDDMDKELDRLESYHYGLRQARVEVGSVRNRSPRLSPIMNLPRELLEYIFELILRDEHWNFVIDDDSYPTGESLEPLTHPDALSGTCMHWRQVVVSTPSLWAYIDLVVSGRHKEKHYSRASRLIERAANLPLLVRIHNPAPSNSNDVRQLTD
ncbi:hypothetical protein FRC12_013924, partial [Ceratobasidium sp. 428]